MNNGGTPNLSDLRNVLERDGKQPVFLYINGGLKFPTYTDWEKTSYQQTQSLAYRKLLEQHPNTGVLLGGNDNLCTIDCDTEMFMAAMLELNPALASTLTSIGERAGQFWIYVTGTRPRKVEHLRVRKD